MPPDDGAAASDRRAARGVVTVIGAAVVDHIYRVERIPGPGESVPGVFESHPGGKGLNRAVAAARLGLAVRLISAVGDDDSGRMILDYLRTENVDIDLVKVIAGARTEATAVMITSTGASANIGCQHDRIRLTAHDLRRPRVHAAIVESDAVLLTFEPPVAVIEQVLTTLRRLRDQPLLIVHPAPELVRPQYLYNSLGVVDYLMGSTINLRAMMPDSSDSTEDIAQRLRVLGVRTVCAVENFRCRVWSDPVYIETPPFPVVLEGSPGAHAAFAAALVTRVLSSRRPADAQDYTWACAAMVATQSFGEVPRAMPRISDVDAIARIITDGP
ncbi:PfkB family carbohydrate kinase [Nocardia nepalensis]|uniref:PfkB family carbohydrate kinase n=1 Tax=Nocardia nepalensis TaxID=3375448 RepID=UPI003B6856D3